MPNNSEEENFVDLRDSNGFLGKVIVEEIDGENRNSKYIGKVFTPSLNGYHPGPIISYKGDLVKFIEGMRIELVSYDPEFTTSSGITCTNEPRYGVFKYTTKDGKELFCALIGYVVLTEVCMTIDTASVFRM
jgi:TusA-related sulfurtransferase